MALSKHIEIDPEREKFLRREAIAIAAQLPPKPEDARLVVEYLQELVEFIDRPDPARETAVVLRLAYEQPL
ncbi:MAG TPA: hypothetical protein VHK66_09205 [Microvirga sp.]|jgi:hypothetical protein|nr:hypothetical protein [Microvirga sp.]